MLTDLADVLRGAGLTVHEVSGWQKRGYLGRSLEAVHGIVLHYTAEPVGTRPEAMARLLSIGRSDLPGPLSQLFLDRFGEWWVVAAGYANHAGAGSWPGLKGNPDCIGIEAANTNKGEVPPAVQVNSWVRGVAAVCDAYDIPTDNIISHAMWSPKRKTDPYGIDVPAFRASVAEERSDMAFTPSEERELKEIVGVLRWYRQDAHTVGDKLLPVLAAMTANEVKQLAGFAQQLEARGSDGAGFADTLIDHIRAGGGQFTEDHFRVLKEVGSMTPEEVQHVVWFAQRLVARGSDGAGFADTLIDHIRAGGGQFTEDHFRVLKEIAEERLGK